MEINEKATIFCLPNELLSEILLHIDISDILNFATTCKRFNQIVKKNNYLWRHKYAGRLTLDVMKNIEKNAPKTEWLKALQKFYLHKQRILNELATMPKEYYWRRNEITLCDLKTFFQISTRTPVNYYYSIFVLRELVKKSDALLSAYKCSLPFYSLTMRYYAIIVLRHLIQLYLVVKWVKMMKTDSRTSPEIIVTFFLQWMDPVFPYDEKYVENEIQKVVQQVKDLLKETSSNREHSERDKLSAISHVIYKIEPVTIFPYIKLSSLDVVKVVRERKGCVIAFGTLYQVVAKHLGVRCDLIAFTNHLFLQWRSSEGSLYVINLQTGDMKLKRPCPFSMGGYSNDSSYCPVALMQYICTSYLGSTSRRLDWKTKDISRLFSLIGPSQNLEEPYRSFLYHLHGKANLRTLKNMNIIYMCPQYTKIIQALYKLCEYPLSYYTRTVVKHRYINVTYAVGMVCYHTEHKYVCVIRDWEPSGRHLDLVPEGGGRDQPHYRVMAGDESDRYVPQEYLKLVTKPIRLQAMEEFIFKDFTHFDGFSYVPSEEKATEYPGDSVYINMYRNHHSGMRYL